MVEEIDVLIARSLVLQTGVVYRGSQELSSRGRHLAGILMQDAHRSAFALSQRGTRLFHHGLPRPEFRLADGTLFAKFGAATRLAWLLVVFPLSQFFLDPAPLQQFLEAAQGKANWLSIVDAHPQRH